MTFLSCSYLGQVRLEPQLGDEAEARFGAELEMGEGERLRLR